VTANPPTGYRFMEWTGTGGFVTTSVNPLTVTNVTAPMTITANFAVKLDQTITFAALADRTYGDAPFALTATASSGLTVSYSSSDEAVATISGGTVTLVGAGTITITASQAGDATYNAAPDVDQSLTVNKATPTVNEWPTASAITYGDALSDSTLNGGDASVPGAFAFTTPATTPDAGIYSASVTFTPTDAANYGTVTGNVDVTVNKATPTVNEWPTASAITYGDALSDSTLSGGDASVPGAFAFTTPATVPGSVGTYSASVTFTPTDAANNSTVTGNVDVTVNKATLTVTAHNKTIAVGQPEPSYTASYVGLVNGDLSTDPDIAATITCPTYVDAVGTYPIIPAGVASTNYDVTYVNGTLTIDLLTYVVTFQTDATPGATVNGVTSLTQAVAHGGDAAAVTATAPVDYHFVNWTQGGADYSIANPLTVTNVTEAMTLVANFAEDVTHMVVFVALEGGTVDGAARVTQTVVDGEDCAPVEAIADADFTFTGWSGDVVGMDNPLTITNVTSDLTMLANFTADEKLAYSLRFPVSADEANAPGGVFSKRPKVWATYYDPIKDPLRRKEKKTSAKVLTKILKGTTVASVDVEWKKKIRLYDLKAFKGEQKIGTSVVLWLANNPIRDLNVSLRASGKENKVPYADGIRTVALACPRLDAVRDAGDTVDVTDLVGREGQQLLLKGRWFGNKPPKVWLEYPPVGKIKPKALKLKVLKPYAFDVNGKIGVSVMDLEDGASSMLVQLPDILPAGIAALVIENGVGMACAEVTTP
jgi:hypothetical protein